MIRIHVPGFYDSDSGGPRWGDAQIIDDGTCYVVIDGYTGTGAKRLISRLKDRNIKKVYLYISHPHGDHDDGVNRILKDNYFTVLGLGCSDPASFKDGVNRNSEVKGDVEFLKDIIARAKAKKVPVRYLKHGDKVKHGDIEFYVYRKQPAFQGNDEDPHGWSYLNDGSLCFWFPSLRYWTSGDGPEKIYDMCRSVGARPAFFHIPHHGNNCPRSQAEGLKDLGALYCWDNDVSTYITDFLRYGRGRCIEAGIRYISCRGDFNVIYFGKRAVIYKDGKIYRHSCSYTGRPTLRTHNADVVRKVIRGSYGTSNDRVTGLLNESYNPGLVQKSVNKVISLAKGIMDGSMSYGKNQDRINRIDKELGAGYGQLVQDYINVLAGVRKQV